jgi:hypothetical protein
VGIPFTVAVSDVGLSEERHAQLAGEDSDILRMTFALIAKI